MHFSKQVLPPPNNVGMKKRFQDRLKCTGLHKLQHCLGAGGKAEKERHIVLIVLRHLSPVVGSKGGYLDDVYRLEDSSVAPAFQNTSQY